MSFLLAMVVVFGVAVSESIAAEVADTNQEEGLPGATQPQITGIRVGPHVSVGAPDYDSANSYCKMCTLADEHTTVFALPRKY
jgi:hypothetical protein